MMRLRRLAPVVVVVCLLSLVGFRPVPAHAAPAITSFTATLLTAPDKVRLSWTTSGAAQAYLFGASDERGLATIGFVPVNGARDVVTGWGIRSYVLGVMDAAGDWRYRTVNTAGLGIDPPAPVTITSANPAVIDYFRTPNPNSPLPDRTITWNSNGASVVKMRACATGGSCKDLPDTTGTSYVVKGNELASVNGDGTFGGLLAPSGQGEVVYELTACMTRADLSLFCGESAKASVRVLPAQTTATFREYRNHPVFLGHTVSWSANGGNWFYLDAPTLGVDNQLTAATSYTFSAAQLNNAGPGLHTIRIKSCKWYGGTTFDCAMNHQVKAASAGTVTDLITAPAGTDVWPIGSIFPTSVAKVNGADHRTSRGGKLVSTCGCQGQSVPAGTVLATVETYDYSLLQLQLGGQTWATRAWTQDFDPVRSTYVQANTLRDVRPGGGFTVNGTSILPNGDIYALGEFTTSAVHVSGGTPQIRPLPFLHKLNRAGTLLQPVRPFGSFGNPTNISNSQDSFKDATGKIWSTQGWASGKPEAQQVTVDATSGNWRLTFSSRQTADIASEATAATVQARLESLANIDPGEVSVTGPAGGPYAVNFKGRLAADVPQMTAQNVSLTGGGASVTVTTTQNGLANHSRVYRYDPSATDSELTLQDDRFCAYNVPGNQNDVMGVASGAGMTWFSESGWSGLSPARLTWFNPNEAAFTNCAAQNTLDYGIADALVPYPPGPAFNPGYCVPPATTNCYHTVEVPKALGAPGHLVFDAARNAIWTSTYTWGTPSSLGRYDISTGNWSVYPLPTQVTHLPPWVPHTWGGSSTWEISVSGDYVYVNDHSDGDIIRFDATRPATDCTTLRNESQRITVEATSGELTLTFSGQVTAGINAEATAATVQSRLEALANVNPGDVAVTGSAGGPYTVSFQGQYATKDVAQLLATNVSLNEGARVSVTTTQPGGQNLCMSELHLPSFWTWQSIARGNRLYWTATGPHGGSLSGGFAKEPYVNDESKFGFIDLNNWGAITSYTGLGTLVAPQRATVGAQTYSWFDVDQASGMVAMGQHARGQFLRLVP
jgi:hypothetical protein